MSYLKIKDQPHDLYRYFDSKNRLLYVGISISAATRLGQHRTASGWYTDAVRIDIEKFASRRAAMSAEKEAIKLEKPQHNIKHVEVEKPICAADYIKDERLTTVTRMFSNYWYDEVAAGHFLGMKPFKVIKLFEEGILGGVQYTTGVKIKVGSRKGQLSTTPYYKFSVWHILEYLEALHMITDKEQEMRQKRLKRV